MGRNGKRPAARRNGMVVTDHALVRYLERCYGLDAEALRQKLAPECLSLAVDCLGDGIYPGPRCRLVVNGHIVKTVLPE